MQHITAVRRPLAALAAMILLTMAGTTVPVAAEKGQVNINTASVEELASLPRIGPAIAQRIIAYRDANGPFQKPTELMNVKGVGEKMFLELKDLITTGKPDKR